MWETAAFQLHPEGTSVPRRHLCQLHGRHHACQITYASVILGRASQTWRRRRARTDRACSRGERQCLGLNLQLPRRRLPPRRGILRLPIHEMRPRVSAGNGRAAGLVVCMRPLRHFLGRYVSFSSFSHCCSRTRQWTGRRHNLIFLNFLVGQV